ncbi:hypothetical protein D9M69_546670 [compost metagenome]
MLIGVGVKAYAHPRKLGQCIDGCLGNRQAVVEITHLIDWSGFHIRDLGDGGIPPKKRVALFDKPLIADVVLSLNILPKTLRQTPRCLMDACRFNSF